MYIFCIFLLSGLGGGLASVTADRQPSRNAQLRIFSDENATRPSILPEQNNEYSSVPLPGVENRQQPRKWTDAKVIEKRNVSHVALFFPSKLLLSQSAEG